MIFQLSVYTKILKYSYTVKQNKKNHILHNYTSVYEVSSQSSSSVKTQGLITTIYMSAEYFLSDFIWFLSYLLSSLRTSAGILLWSWSGFGSHHSPRTQTACTPLSAGGNTKAGHILNTPPLTWAPGSGPSLRLHVGLGKGLECIDWLPVTFSCHLQHIYLFNAPDEGFVRIDSPAMSKDNERQTEESQLSFSCSPAGSALKTPRLPLWFHFKALRESKEQEQHPYHFTGFRSQTWAALDGIYQLGHMLNVSDSSFIYMIWVWTMEQWIAESAVITSAVW